MKKMKVLLASVFTLVICLFCFAGCSAAGTYKFQSLTVEVLGFAKTYEIGQEYNGEELEADYMTLKLNSDGTATITWDEDDTSFNCEWEQGDDGVITFKQEGITIYKATVEGMTMTLEGDALGLAGMKIVLKRGLLPF